LRMGNSGRFTNCPYEEIAIQQSPTALQAEPPLHKGALIFTREAFFAGGDLADQAYAFGDWI